MDRLTAADAWYLYLEGPTVHLHVTGLLLLDPSTAPDGFSFDTLRSFITERLHLMPTLRRRLVEVPLSIDHPTWIDDPDFDLDEHLHHRTLGGTGSDAELAAMIGEFASRPLRRDRPLWDMTLVEGLAGGGAAVAMKMHHCIVDGVSGMEIMAQLLDLDPEPTPHEPPRLHRPATVPSRLDAAVSATWSRLTDPLRPLRAASGAATSMVGMAETAVRRRLGGAAAVAHPVNAPRTRFNASIGPDREVAFGLAPLADLKAVRSAFDVTINDVVLAACSYGLRQYLQSWDRVPDRPLVCSVPVSTHGHGDPATNQVSNMFVNLPVHLDDPVEQLMAIHRGSVGAKEVQGSVGTHLISDVIELIPAMAFQFGTRLYSATGLADRLAPVHNLIVSNVKGSPVPLYMAGARVAAMYPFGPLMEGAGLNITVLSNNGEMNLGLIACPDLVPSLDSLLDETIAGITVLREASQHV